jgi:hypothetical protein
MSNNPDTRRHVIFEKGCEKIPKDLDAVNLIKAVKIIKLLPRVLLEKTQRSMLRY